MLPSLRDSFRTLVRPFQGSWCLWPRKSISGKKKAHKHKFFCPVGLGTTPGLSRGFHRVCPWDKSGENLGQTRVFSLFYTVEARFHRVCPWDKPGLSLGQSRGRRAAQKVYVKKIYVPFSLASIFKFSSDRFGFRARRAGETLCGGRGIASSGSNQGRGNRSPIDDRNPIRKCGIHCIEAWIGARYTGCCLYRA